MEEPVVKKSQALSFFISNGRFIMNEEYLKELIVGIRVFLWMLSIKIKALSLTEFWKLLEGCSSQQKLYAVWLRYYFQKERCYENQGSQYELYPF